ncbi:hypothetical protein AKJ52_01610 [candidate division MSBL1 archaeon SCGC-AAA382C18]|uniref:Molybdenum hydroxylase n=1 Tax=candidate division MSBL1 archaeon SCGC-AAA382C18 TaxID=1698281 RepID=A0A133VJZ8_9EURY|nr:hypothetical protein AKJ52_01610 [candidate division MSBL1 archaeon SCGC-AAA382C18]
MENDLKVVVKGAGEVASGVAYFLFSKDFPIIMTDVSKPTTQRRTVAFAEAIFSGEIEVEGVKAKKVKTNDDLFAILDDGFIPVVVDPEAGIVDDVNPEILVDGIMAKKNLGTNRKDADLVIGLGPGFSAGEDVDVVIETAEGSSLGEVIQEGEALPNTSMACDIRGYTNERVLRAPSDGIFKTSVKIGDLVEAGDKVGEVGEKKVEAEISGSIRGIVKDGLEVAENQKLGDIDPRGLREFRISDRSLAIANGVWNAIRDRFSL